VTNDRLVTASRADDDAQYEAGLRPRRLDEYIGQDRVRENLQVAITSATKASLNASMSCTVMFSRRWLAT